MLINAPINYLEHIARFPGKYVTDFRPYFPSGHVHK